MILSEREANATFDWASIGLKKRHLWVTGPSVRSEAPKSFSPSTKVHEGNNMAPVRI